MDSNSTGGFWHEYFRSWPLSTKIGLGIIIAIAVVLLLFFTVESGRDIEIGPSSIIIKRSETKLERSCRLEIQKLSLSDQNTNSEIIALEAQVATKDHELSETRQRCLAAPANTPHFKNESRCRTQINEFDSFVTTFADSRNDYETEVNSIAEERKTLKSKIAAKEQEREQRQQRLSQRCFGTEGHAP